MNTYPCTCVCRAKKVIVVDDGADLGLELPAEGEDDIHDKDDDEEEEDEEEEEEDKKTKQKKENNKTNSEQKKKKENKGKKEEEEEDDKEAEEEEEEEDEEQEKKLAEKKKKKKANNKKGTQEKKKEEGEEEDDDKEDEEEEEEEEGQEQQTRTKSGKPAKGAAYQPEGRQYVRDRSKTIRQDLTDHANTVIHRSPAKAAEKPAKRKRGVRSSPCTPQSAFLLLPVYCLLLAVQPVILMGGWYKKLVSGAKTMTRRVWKPKTQEKFREAWKKNILVRVWDSDWAKSGKPYGHVNTVGFLKLHGIWEEKLRDMRPEQVELEGGEMDESPTEFMKKHFPGADLDAQMCVVVFSFFDLSTMPNMKC